MLFKLMLGQSNVTPLIRCVIRYAVIMRNEGKTLKPITNVLITCLVPLLPEVR